MKCRVCKLVRKELPTPEGVISELYETVDPVEHVSQSRLSLYSHFLDAASERFDKPHRLLDVGCSNGTFIELAIEKDWQAFGLEPAEMLARSAQNRGLKVYKGVLSHTPREWGPFDLITYWDSFMLVDNPAEEMQRILNCLNEDGWIYLRLRQHGIQRFLYRVWKVCGSHLHLPNPSVYHPYNFLPGTIKTLACRFNLRVNISNATFTVGDPYSTMRYVTILKGIKWIGMCFAWIICRLSLGRCIMSPGMDIWMQRKVNRKTP